MRLVGLRSARILVLVLLATGAPCWGAPTPVEELAKAPADAQRFTVLSSVGKHGESTRWVTAEGVRMGRESYVLRGQIFEVDSAAHVGKDGMLESVAVRGFTPNGDAAESFSSADGKVSWKSPVDAAGAAYAAPAEYVAFGGPMDLTADLAEALVAAPGRSFALLPGGHAQALLLATASVGEGTQERTVTAYAITGLSNTPIPVWFDNKGHFFAMVSSISWLPAGYEGALDLLQKAQDDALADHSPAVFRALLKTPAGPVAFTHVRAFLDGTHFAQDRTVIVERGVITRIESAGSKLPASAQVIDGAGKTLVPGLWDSHMHFADDASGPMLLSLGITSCRDPGNINELTLARGERRAHDLLLSPQVYASVLIDGKGPNTAQMATVVTTQQEALAAVRKAKADGFLGIKIYGTFNPSWVKATAAEAHRLGLHVHGHLPQACGPCRRSTTATTRSRTSIS